MVKVAIVMGAPPGLSFRLWKYRQKARYRVSIKTVFLRVVAGVGYVKVVTGKEDPRECLRVRVIKPCLS